MTRRSTSDRRSTPGAVPVDEVMAAVPGGALLLDLDGHVALANPAAEELLGAGPSTLEPLWARVLEDLLSGAAVDAVRIPAPGPDGPRVLAVTISPLRGGDREWRLATISDVSELVALEARVAHLEAFAAVSRDALFACDTSGRIATWGHNAERILGHPEAAIVGKAVEVLFPEHVRTEMKVVLEAVAEGERVEQVQAEVERGDGMRVPIALSMSPVLDRDGDVVGAVAVAQDLTEERLTQAALGEVEAMLREGEALAHIGRWVWDVGTDAVQWSDELHRIHDVDPLDFAGTIDAFMACVHEDDRGRVRSAMQAAVDAGRRFEAEYRTRRADGSLGWVYARAEPMLGSAEVVVGLRGIGQDLTDRRRGADAD
jgi:PAS domain S-box-containing protein